MMRFVWVFTFLFVSIYLQAKAANYCGDSFSSAKSCENACPQGIDSECPSGETCYAEVPCSTDDDSEDDDEDDGTDPGQDVDFKRGIYLEKNPPAITQYRSRKATPRSVIVLHTAESGSNSGPPDDRAENTARFISNRENYGSYHMIGDTDSIIKLVRFRDAAFHDGTGSNEWSVGISLAIDAADWPSFDEETKNRLVAVMAQMAARAANWMDRKGYGKPAALRLSKEESESESASGFISHADRDPARRSDPGADFPWEDFFAAYESRI